MNRHPRISKKTHVVVTRCVKAFRDQEPDIWGPMPLDQAIKSGHLQSSSGTVSVEIRVADGEEHAGANVYRDSQGIFRAQRDPY